MKISLRPYQNEAVEKIIESFERGKTRQLITLPTGSGKTVVMAALAKQLGKRTLLLAHREELIHQAKDKFQMVCPEIESGICMGDYNETDQSIVFGSVQSCYQESRLEKLLENNFELLLIDEAHHSSASTYNKIIKRLGFLDSKGEKLLVGVTATPMRSDSNDLGNIFEEVTYELSIGKMIQEGYLSPVIGRRILTKINIGKVKIQSGDFAIGDLSEAINTQERNQFIAENYVKYASNRKGVVFACDIQHCKDLEKAFLKLQISTKAIYSNMISDERRKSLEGLKNGEIQVLISCGILTEGFDEPSISCIVMARPTKFKGLYIQCIGRGLRSHPSKTDCLVLDFTDEGHDLNAVASLGKVIPEASLINELKSKDKKEDKEHTIQIKRECNVEFSLLGNSRFIWAYLEDDEWSLLDDEENEIVMSPCRDGYVAKIYFEDGSEKNLVKDPIAMEYCFGICEDYARKNFKLSYASEQATWMDQEIELTDNQKQILHNNGIHTDGMTKGQAFKKIRELFARQKKYNRKHNKITPKQAMFLKRNGVDTKRINKKQAQLLISMIKSGNTTKRYARGYGKIW